MEKVLVDEVASAPAGADGKLPERVQEALAGLDRKWTLRARSALAVDARNRLDAAVS